MSEYRVLKTVNAPIKRKNRPILYIKKHMILENKKSHEKYAIFEFVNDYKEEINKITILVGQFDENGKLINKNRIPYSELNIKPYSKFVPFFKLGLDKKTSTIRVLIIDAEYQYSYYKNGIITKKEETLEDTDKLKDGLNKNYNEKHLSHPFKMPLILGSISVAFTLIFIMIFGIGNRTIIESNIKFNKATGEIIEYIGSNPYVSIPEKIGGKEVKSIKDRAFYGSSITSITINSSSIESIGDYAFANCQNLSGIVGFNTSVGEIGDHAFENCKNLTRIELKSISTIGDYAFNNCKSLSNFEYDTVNSIGTSTFYGCEKLANVLIKNAVITNRLFDENCTNLRQVVFNSTTSTNVNLENIFYKLDTDNIIIETYINECYEGFISDSFRCKRLSFLNPSITFENSEYEKWTNLADLKGCHYYTSEYEVVFGAITTYYLTDDILNNTELTINDPGITSILSSAVNEIAPYVITLTIDSDIHINYELLRKFNNVKNFSILNINSTIDDYSIPFTNLEYLDIPVLNNKFADLFMLNPISTITVNINSSLNGSISEKYFNDCQFIEKLSINNVSIIEKNAIYDCINLKTLIISNTTNNMTLPIISGDCFNLTKVSIPYVGENIISPKLYSELNTCYIVTEELYITCDNVPILENAFADLSSLEKLSIPNGMDSPVRLGINRDVLLIIKVNSNTNIYTLYDSLFIDSVCLLGGTQSPNIIESNIADINNLYVDGNFYLLNEVYSVIEHFYYEKTINMSLFSNINEANLVSDVTSLDEIGGITLK